MSWLASSKKNLLPLSRERVDFVLALTEWEYTGRYNDLDPERSDCELCEHPEIRFQFEIKNRLTTKKLLVGSECIRKFAISALSEEGELLDSRESGRKVARDRRSLIARAEARRIVHALVSLAVEDEAFNIDSFIEYFQERGAFTPNQLALLLWRLDEKGIRYEKCRFKIIVRRDREKDQLRTIPRWKLKKLWPYMTVTQRELCRAIRAQTA
jgi:hypothetical protein